MTRESQRLETLAGIIRLLAFVRTTRLTGVMVIYDLVAPYYPIFPAKAR